MNIFKLLGELLVVYILYKVIFDFIIPIYKATNQVKDKMKDVQERMQEQQRAQEKPYEPGKVQRDPKPADEEYIDYEEVTNKPPRPAGTPPREGN